MSEGRGPSLHSHSDLAVHDSTDSRCCENPSNYFSALIPAFGQDLQRCSAAQQRLATIIADGLDGAGVCRFLAKGNLIIIGRLNEQERVPTISSPIKIWSRRPAQVAVDALVVHVERSVYILRMLVFDVSHNILLTASCWTLERLIARRQITAPACPASSSQHLWKATEYPSTRESSTSLLVDQVLQPPKRADYRQMPDHCANDCGPVNSLAPQKALGGHTSGTTPALTKPEHHHARAASAGATASGFLRSGRFPSQITCSYI